MNWTSYAAELASRITHPTSPWAPFVESVPRHQLVSRWWRPTGESLDGPSWELVDDSRGTRWPAQAYEDRTYVTQVGTVRADLAVPGDRATGKVTSSSTAPGTLVRLLDHARLVGGADVLYVGTGSGYGCALVAARLGGQHVTGIDIDEHATKTAAAHLAHLDLHPRLITADATRPLPEPATFDRIISTIGVRPIPVAWLDALRPGGRLVTTIASTGLIITADKTPEGLRGQVEWDRAVFEVGRSGPDYPPPLSTRQSLFRDAGGEQISEGRFPIIDLTRAVELRSMLAIVAPGIEHYHQTVDDGRRVAWMFHPDGSWARAIGARSTPPRVFQGGPRRLWHALDDLRGTWLREGSLPVLGATATITPHGVIHLKHGPWRASIR